MKTNKLSKIITNVVASVLLLTSATPLFAQSSEWAVKMFSEMGTERMHNFGSVALHADVEKRFEFKNIYNEDVVVSSVSSNCGCTKASVSKQVVHPGETAEVIARVDTSGREHTKQRRATLRVVFSKPSPAEVQLQVKTFIRPDVGFDPGSIEFGTVQHGAKVVKKAYLQYAGRSDWALTGIQKNNPGIRAEAREVRRQNGNIVYEILVELKPEATPGYIHDLLRFQTNESDPTTSSIFLPVQGLVVEPLSAKPSFLQLGVVATGQKITRNVVVSGAEPFKILEINADDERISSAKTDLKRAVHVLPITFSADEEAGPIEGEISIVTSQKSDDGEYLTLNISMTGVVRDSSASSEETAIPAKTQKKDKSDPTSIRPNRGIPAAEDLEPEPLSKATSPSAAEKSLARLETSVRKNNVPERLAADVKDAAEENDQTLVWKPVKKDELDKIKRLPQKSNTLEEGEWTSNWKQVRTDVEPELVAQEQSQTIVK